VFEQVRQRVTFHRNEYAVWPGVYARRSTSAERYLVSGPEARASAATNSGRFEVSFIFTSSNPNTPGKALYFEKYVSSPSSNQGVRAARTARIRRISSFRRTGPANQGPRLDPFRFVLDRKCAQYGC
jgi:hypothetical protein